MKVLVTGASGFVGDAVYKTLQLKTGVFPVPVFRHGSANQRQVGKTPYFIDGLDSRQDWRDGLLGVDVVVHCAARVHVMKESVSDPLAEFRRINVDGTLKLARQAAECGVKRFIFISTIKVNGEETAPDRPFTENQAPRPADPYGISKAEAEAALMAVSKATGMEVVVLRPSLIYGPGVKGNLQSLMRWLARRWPLPLGAATENRRDLLALDNLVDFIVACLDHPAAANQVFLLADGQPMSTAFLIRRMADAMGCSARLIPVPLAFLGFFLKALGRRSVASRLWGSLEIDIGKARRLLAWVPPVSVEEGMRKMCSGAIHSASHRFGG